VKIPLYIAGSGKRPSSSGQDGALSRRKQGFDSPWAYQKNPEFAVPSEEFKSAFRPQRISPADQTRWPVAKCTISPLSRLKDGCREEIAGWCSYEAVVRNPHLRRARRNRCRRLHAYVGRQHPARLCTDHRQGRAGAGRHVRAGATPGERHVAEPAGACAAAAARGVQSSSGLPRCTADNTDAGRAAGFHGHLRPDEGRNRPCPGRVPLAECEGRSGPTWMPR
jgi:hypothetical protein